MPSQDEIEALKQEVEQLRKQLEKERLRNDSARNGNTLPSSSSLPRPEFERQQENIPITKPTDSEKPAHQHQQTESSTPSTSLKYTQIVPVNSKRGKWWLKDRQILTSNVSPPNEQTVAMKVRETWMWSGRMVVVDKILLAPRHIDDHENDLLHIAQHDENEQDTTGLGRERVRAHQSDKTHYQADDNLEHSILSSSQVSASQSSKIAQGVYIEKSKHKDKDDDKQTTAQRMDDELTRVATAVEYATLNSKSKKINDTSPNSTVSLSSSRNDRNLVQLHGD